MADTAALVRAVSVHKLATDRVRVRVRSYVRRHWNSLGHWNRTDAERFVDQIVPVVLAGQQQMAALTDAYLAQITRLVTGTGRPKGVTIPEELRGVPPVEVYHRPFETVWWRLAEGDAFDQALRLGLQRLDTITATDLQLGLTRASQEWMDDEKRFQGYRRTLSGGTTCGLCAAASTRRYHRKDLMPIHEHCDCGVAPIFDSIDVGEVIDEERLAAVQEGAGDRYSETTRGSDGKLHASGLKRTRGWVDDDGQIHWTTPPEGAKGLPEIAVHEHGEIGPVITQKHHHFRGPSDL